MNQPNKHPLQRACELRLMAAAIELQHLSGPGANLVPIPMVRGETAPRFIAVGTLVDIRRQLDIAPECGAGGHAAHAGP